MPCLGPRAVAYVALITTLLLLAFALPAWAAAGDLDPSFSGDGTKTVDFAGRFEFANAVAVQPNGRIVIAGDVHREEDIGLARLTPRGHLDRTFGGDGTTVSDAGGAEGAVDVALTQDGRIVVAAGGPAQDRPGFIAGRYRDDGSLDASFGGDGLVEVAPKAGSSAAAVAVQSDGKVVEAGTIRAGGENNPDFGIVRFQRDGDLDSGFGRAGVKLVDFGKGGAQAEDVEVLRDGSILVVGSAFRGGARQFAFAKLEPDGSLDKTFSADGRLAIDVGPGDDAASALDVLADERIVAAGCATCESPSDVAIARLRPDGSRDLTFSGDGLRVLDPTHDDEAASDVVVQRDGRIVIAGCSPCFTAPENDFLLVRVQANGARDATFGHNGVVRTGFKHQSDSVRALGVAPDGALVAVGASRDVIRSKFAVARYLAS